MATTSLKKNLPIYKQKVNPLPLFSQRVALIQPALHLNWDAEPGALHSSGKRKGGLSHVRILVTSHYWDGFGYGPSHDSESGSQISDATKTTHLPLESGGYDFRRKSLKQKLHQVWELHSNRGLPNKNRADVPNVRGKSAPTNV